MIQVKNYINITFKLQQLVFTKHFSVVSFKLQLSNLNLKCTMANLCAKSLYNTILFVIVILNH